MHALPALAPASRPCRVLLASILLLSGCSSAPLGRVPIALIGLHDAALPGGVIEIELDRDGRVRELEAEVSLESLPAVVLAAARREIPGAHLTGAELELHPDGDFYEVQLVSSGRAWELVIDASGAVRETEKELALGEAPPGVLEAAERALPGGELTSVELIERGEAREYHVKKLRSGARYKIVLAADGSLLRCVREARAEIELPLPG